MIFEAAALLNNFVPVIDRLKELAKTRDQDRQRLVNDIVAPYFDELQIAYTAYLETLRKAKKMVEGGQSFPAVYSEIEVLRGADLIAREKSARWQTHMKAIYPPTRTSSASLEELSTYSAIGMGIIGVARRAYSAHSKKVRSNVGAVRFSSIRLR